MVQQRWLRIIPLALIMYTVAYIDRTNVNLILDPKISSMMKDLAMNDEMKGQAIGIFFYGYLLLQIPGSILASRWSARKTISICLFAWGISAALCGLASSIGQFEWMRFFLGMSESAVFPATAVLLTQWFPRAERARANSLWLLCQPIAIAGTGPITGYLLDHYQWQKTFFIEGALPFLFLPFWWFYIRDHPREANWISPAERDHLETTLSAEAAELQPAQPIPWYVRLRHPSIFVMVALYFFHNCAAYGCSGFFTSTLDSRSFTGLQKGVFYAVPYILTAFLMVINSWHSDKTGERRGHVAIAYFVSGTSLILSVVTREHFWVSYGFLCFAIPGPYVAMCPFWTIPAETLPPAALAMVVGLVNAFGNLGGYVGPRFTGWVKNETNSTAIPFIALGVGMLLCVGFAYLMPKSKPRVVAT